MQSKYIDASDDILVRKMEHKFWGWGNNCSVLSRAVDLKRDAEYLDGGYEFSCIARGMGRSYGDASLNSNAMIVTKKRNRILSFDRDSGVLRCESGVLIKDIIDIFLCRGWFLPVTPGTKFVSVGGALGSDVHGKNHHRDGGFSQFVAGFHLQCADGKIVYCTPESSSELFEATAGGMGLTGVILDVTLQLMPVQSSCIFQKNIKTSDLDDTLTQLKDSAEWKYSVAWVDCFSSGRHMGRAILSLGEHATHEHFSDNTPLFIPEQEEKRLAVPRFTPGVMMNAFVGKNFNQWYYGKERSGESIVSVDSFFYPLDGLHMWNRLYGRRGFVQYQFVIPLNESYLGIKKIIQLISESKHSPMLAVLKVLGNEKNTLSFPLPGYTLAVDFPSTPGLPSFIQTLDEVVANYGGRVYLAKDSMMSGDYFRQTYGDKVNRFLDQKKTVDPELRFQSELSKRIQLF